MIAFSRRGLFTAAALIGMSPDSAPAAAKEYDRPEAKTRRVKADFSIQSFLSILKDATFRISTYTDADSILYETVEPYDYANWISSGRNSYIEMPSMPIQEEGSVRVSARRGLTIFEAYSTIGPVMNGKIFFRIEPVTRTDEVVTRQTEGQGITTTGRDYVPEMIGLRLLPRAKESHVES